MKLPANLDDLHVVLAASALILALALHLQRKRIHSLEESTTALKEKLARIEAAPTEFIHRIERYDVLWFASVMASVIDKRIISAKPGLPFCSKCVLPLASAQGITPWKCPSCGSAYADSLGTLTVTDTVVGMALEQFRLTHRDYLGPA